MKRLSNTEAELKKKRCLKKTCVRGQRENLCFTLSYLYKSFVYHIKAVTVLERFRLATCSYAASFSIKTYLDKTNNLFLNSKNKTTYLNQLVVHESKLKRKKL